MEICLSTTDPECGFMSRENKQERICYLDHRTTHMYVQHAESEAPGAEISRPFAGGVFDENLVD